jgi:GDPmannose 4,6-dehydratase
MARALITGITGQDGSYLTELLLAKGYEVHGLVRRTSSLDRSWPGPLLKKPELAKRLSFHYADLDDATALRRILIKAAPDELYHLAGQTNAALSFEIPEATADATAIAPLRLLEIIRDLPKAPRFFQASSSEIFGRPEVTPQDEQTPFRPVTPYGCAKVFATQMVSVYRQAHRLFACNGILFNHESPRRGAGFVTQKICRAAAAIKHGRQKELRMGSLATKRDWGDARDYVRGMWLALQHDKPEDFVFATGLLHSVQDVVEIAFGVAGIDWRQCVVEDPQFIRPDEPAPLIGNPAKAKKLLNWEPSTDFKQLITEMTQFALDELKSGSRAS